MGADASLPTLSQPDSSPTGGGWERANPSPTGGGQERVSIVAMGDLVHDVLIKSDEEELSLESDITAHITVQPGGSAANFAVQAARLLGDSGQVSFISKVGADDSGLALSQSLEREAVRPYLTVAEDGSATGTVLVFINRSGRRTMVTDPGASRTLSVAELELNASLLTRAHAFHLTSYSLFTDPPRPAALRAAQLAKHGGALISLDPSSHHIIELLGRERYIALAEQVRADIFLPNIDEGRLLSGETEPQAIVQAMRRFAPIVALKLGADGCLISAGDSKPQHIPAAATTCVDSTGAGDAFDAAFIVGYLRMGDALAAGKLANEVAAQVVARLGAR